MAKLILSAVMATGLMAGLNVVVNSEADATASGVDAKFVAYEPLHNSRTWLLAEGNGSDICLLTKLETGNGKSARVEADPTCAQMLEAADEIQTWQEDSDGNVVLADAQGLPVLEFGLGDDDALISITGEVGAFSLTPNS